MHIIVDTVKPKCIIDPAELKTLPKGLNPFYQLEG